MQTEYICRDPSNQARACISYKSGHTVNADTSVASNGALDCSSKLYRESTSNVEYVRHSGILQKFTIENQIVADEDSTVHDQLPAGDLPSQSIGKAIVTHAEGRLSNAVAGAGIRLKWIKQRLKTYDILNHIPASYRSISTKIFQICCCLVDLQDPRVQIVADKW